MKAGAAYPLVPRVLVGADRTRHVQLVQTSINHGVNDRELSSIVARDPSVLLEGANRLLMSYEAGTLFDAFAFLNYEKTIEVGLKAGIHPDDPSAFRCDRLGTKFGAPRLLAVRDGTSSQMMPLSRIVKMALAHGASPDGELEAFLQGQRNTLVRQYAMYLQFSITDRVLQETLMSLQLLLQANPRGVEPRSDGHNSDWTGFLTLLGMAKHLKGAHPLDGEMAASFRGIVELAIDKGARIGFAQDRAPTTPTLLSIAGTHPLLPCLATEMAGPAVWGTPPQPVESYFKEDGLAMYREAVMRHALSAPPSEHIHARSVQRRRRYV